MKPEELYQKEFGNSDSIPKESVLRLLRNFAKALKLEREKSLDIHDVIGRSEQLKINLKEEYERGYNDGIKYGIAASGGGR